MALITPTGFHSFNEYWRFVWAREFCDAATHERVDYAKTRLEKLGDFMVYPIMRGTDHALRNIRNPLMILSVTLTALVAVTILFYPEEFMGTIARTIPFALNLKPWMIQAALFTTIQTTILGVAVRALGRLDPSGPLWARWNLEPREIRPIAVGTQIVRAGA